MRRKIKINKELPKAYNPAEHEDVIYKTWETSGYFNPDKSRGEPFSIMMPPPNVTGVLHLGHALENSLMDIMARYQRMKGKKVLLLPGTDHAAVATQAKVEKVLIEQGMKNPRQELGREGLLKEIREYAENSKSTILKQIRKMGTSCDWSRLAYTFDEARSRAVNEIFVKMYNDGLIYRGHRVVNWSSKGQSTCSDDELVYEERKAKLYTFKYSKDFPIPIATTRPETKLGDTAVAVHPKGKWKKFIGKIFKADAGAAKPLEIKVISDSSVDEKFGTGAIGVTPAHSMIDFEMYEKEKAKGNPIGLVQVIGQDGKMTEAAGKDYAGLTVSEAREKFVNWLKQAGLLIKEEEINQNVGKSDRFGDVVEVLPMTQWFVDVNKKIPGKNKSLKDLMREAVTIGHKGDADQKVKITPERFEKVYLNWIDNLRDWCVSRQIWWGHRIPVWYCGGRDRGECLPECHRPIVSVEAPKKCPVCGSKDLIQDEDTLDTWFSSGLWTFSTLGWPLTSPNPSFVKRGTNKDGKNDLQTFHPTSWMQMGYEILFFWMARMILMSTYALDQIPFKDVYIHGILRNEQGKKFSKSAGDNIDPLEIIKKYGTDALRLSLISGIAPGNDSKFYEEKVEGARNLVNKIWNVARYIITNEMLSLRSAPLQHDRLTLADKWILGKMENLIKEVTKELDNYNFSQAGEKLREFTWDDLADWYLEASKFEKSENKAEVLTFLLENLLKLWHPFMPFVTEKIWEEMGGKKMLMVEEWPIPLTPLIPPTPFIKGEPLKGTKTPQPPLSGWRAESDFELVKQIIIAIRNARAENKIEAGQKIKAVIYAGKNEKLIKSQAEVIKGLRTGISELEIKDKKETSPSPSFVRRGTNTFVKGDIKGKSPLTPLDRGGENAITAVVGEIEIYLIAEVDKTKEKARLEKEIIDLEKLISGGEARMKNKEFISKAPKAIVEKEKEKLAGWKTELKKLREQVEKI